MGLAANCATAHFVRRIEPPMVLALEGERSLKLLDSGNTSTYNCVVNHWYTLRWQVLKRDDFTCRYCGRSAPDVVLHIDHVQPRSAGGSDDPSNLVVACAACNIGRGTDGLRPREPRTRKQATPMLDKVMAYFEEFEQPTTASEMAVAIGTNRANLSAFLFKSGLFTSRRDGHNVYYYPR